MKSDELITFHHFSSLFITFQMFFIFFKIVENFVNSGLFFCGKKSLSHLQLFWTSDQFCALVRYLFEEQ